MRQSLRIARFAVAAALAWIAEAAGISPDACGQVIVTGTPSATEVFAQQGGGGRGGGRRGRGARGGEGQQPAGENANAEGGQANGGGRGGRGRRGGRGENQGDATATSGARQGGAAAPNDAMRQLFARSDRNGDGVLQTDEARFLGGRAASFDTDGNGVITQEEFNSGLSGASTRGRGRGPAAENNNSESSPSESNRGRNNNRGNDEGDSGGASNNNNRNRGNNNDDDNDNSRNRNRSGRAAERPVEVAKTFPSLITDRKSYRLQSSGGQASREGIPSWFASRDANRDGQVALSEYAARLTERLLEEFLQRDKNGDGFITADEAAGSR